MSIYRMTKDELIAKAERDDAAISRAAATLNDNAVLQAKVRELRARMAEEKAKPPHVEVRELRARLAKEKAKPPHVEVRDVERVVVKEVPTPCPDQAAQIKALQSRLVEIARGVK